MITIKTVIVGAGGHARVIFEILRHDRNIKVVAFVDNVADTSNEMIRNIPVVGGHSILPNLLNENVTGAIIGVGDNKLRSTHFEMIKNLGFEIIKAIHPTSHIAYDVKIGDGVVISTGATIATETIIGDNVIINTGAIVEHENIIEDGVHIAPGTSIAGRVTIKKGTFIGIGSVIKEYITIGENVVIGAGSVVLDDIPDNAVAVGSPARIVKINNK